MSIMSSSSRWSLALLSHSTHHSQGLIPQLWHTCNLHGDHNFPGQRGRLQGHHCPVVHRVKATGERHSCQMKQVCLPPYVRFCSTFISLLGLNNTAHHNWLHQLDFPCPIQPRCCCCFPLFNQNTERHMLCASERKQSRKDSSILELTGRDKKDVLHPVTQALNISFFQHCEIVTIIWNSVYVEDCRAVVYRCLNMHMLARGQNWFKITRKENHSQICDCSFHLYFCPQWIIF